MFIGEVIRKKSGWIMWAEFIPVALTDWVEKHEIQHDSLGDLTPSEYLIDNSKTGKL